jgi:hypothetical protein
MGKRNVKTLGQNVGKGQNITVWERTAINRLEI